MILVGELFSELHRELLWLLQQGQTERATHLAERMVGINDRFVSRSEAVLAMQKVAQETIAKQTELGTVIRPPHPPDTDNTDTQPMPPEA